MKFSERLKSLRKDFRYTQKILEEITGIARSTISAYELGTRNPSVDNLITLARVFRVSIDYLCGNTDKCLIDITDISQHSYSKIVTILREENINIEN